MLVTSGSPSARATSRDAQNVPDVMTRSVGTASALGPVPAMNVPARIRQRDRRRSEGFTLVELAVVVTIVGVLAVLAVVGYRRLITSAHLTEATGMVNGIRVAQESYHAETGVYATIGTSGTLAWATTTRHRYPLVEHQPMSG